MKDTIEVLAPAGNWESLRAAVYSGADAVYLAGKAFGARASAQNFTDEELAEAVAFCHARGVHVHVTVNTLIKDAEMEQVMRFIRYLCEISVDAVLVQDMGLFHRIRECAPDLVVHASTQMSLHSRGGAQFIQDAGAARVVLARELSLPEIEEISRECTIETESFVHGALCVCLSGQCYFSATLGSRSGNRGMCAQTCRLPFQAEGGGDHALSLKDMSWIDEIGKLARAGVTSAKIEGRMKRPEYVAAAVASCRKGADGERIPEDLRKSLASVFSRSGFTKGYLEGKIDESMLGVRRKQDVTAATEKVFGGLRGLYRKELARIPVRFTLMAGDCLRLTADDGENPTQEITAPIENAPLLDKERCVTQLCKTGGTPFLAQDIVVSGEGIPITISTLNMMRRELLKTLLRVREHRPEIEFLCKSEQLVKKRKIGMDKSSAHMKWVGSFQTIDQITKETSMLDGVILPLLTEGEKIDQLPFSASQVMLEIPRAIFGRASEEKIKRQMEAHRDAGRMDFICGNLGAIQLCREVGVRAHGGWSLNLANSEALDFFAEAGLHSAQLSPELTLKEIAALERSSTGGEAMPVGVTVYGRQAVMINRKCPAKSAAHPCTKCGGKTTLIDRQKKEFPVMCTLAGTNKYTEVFNSVPLWMADRLVEIKGADFGVLRFTVENPVECGRIITAFSRQEKPDSDYTRGLFYRGIL